MTQTDIEWLQAKRKEWERTKKERLSYLALGYDIDMWDLPQWLAIIDELEREIRRLKTELARK